MYIISNGELMHHGVKGQKWGKRRYQNSDGSLTPAGRQRYGSDLRTSEVLKTKMAYKQAKKDYNKSFNKAYNKAIAAYSPIRKHRAANDRRWEDAINKAEELDVAKKAYKTARKSATKAAVKDYNKSYNEWDKMQDKADTKWLKANEQYKSLGRTTVGRMLAAARNKTDAAKAYHKTREEQRKAQSLADTKYIEVEAKYKTTGRTYISRIANNIRYSK